MLGLLSFTVTAAMFSVVLKICRKYNIYDNPDARKLQREPVPVLGGVAIFIGVFVGMVIILARWPNVRYLCALVAMLLLLVIGVIDDVRSLSVKLRFAVEFVTVALSILFSGNMIDSLGGVFGIYGLSPWVSYPLSLIAGVGIINAINLMDGIDGYSSGYITFVCIAFGLIYFFSAQYPSACICFCCGAALLPFFIHNVFGRKTKMFMGDGGTLMLGALIVSLVFSLLREGSLCYSMAMSHNINLVSLVLAILCIPVFDTVRVMTMRMLRGVSPFHPGKDHMHHLLIDYGFTHLNATFTLLLFEFAVMLIWLAVWQLGGSPTVQLAAVVLAGFAMTFHQYQFYRRQERKKTNLYYRVCRLAKRVNFDKTGVLWLKAERIADASILNALTGRSSTPKE